jgi:glycosyltransferase involved in cell wall biosynthesis
MKLAMVVPGGVDRSGEHRVIPTLLALIKHLARDHEVHVFSLYQEAQPGRWPLAGAEIHNVGQRRARLRGLAAIIAEHRKSPFSVIQSIFSGACGQVAITAGALLRLPVAVHVAGGEPVALPDIAYGGRLHWRSRVAESVVLRRASLVTAASQPMLELLKSQGIKASLLPLGVDLEQWPLRLPRPRDPARQARLLHVGSLNRVKDQTMLLQALARLAAARVPFIADIVGEDTLDGAVQRLAATLGLEARIKFHGFRTQRELRPLCEAADVLVVSSRHEAGPLVVLEAGAVGVPTVGTAVGHLCEWAPDAALTVPVGDATALAGSLMALLADEPRRLRMGANAAERAAKMSAAHTARQFTEHYRRLAAA